MARLAKELAEIQKAQLEADRLAEEAAKERERKRHQHEEEMRKIAKNLEEEQARIAAERLRIQQEAEEKLRLQREEEARIAAEEEAQVGI